MTTAQQTAIQNLAAEWGESFNVESTDAEGDITVIRASDHPYYEPNPIRYIITTDGDADELDSDGFRIELDRSDWA